MTVETVTPEVEAAAREMGWAPKDEFRGDTAKWVDAAEFVRRGENFVPILRADNRRLKAELDAERGKVAKLQTDQSELAESVEALKKHQTESTKAAVEAAKANILAQLKRAKKDGDTDLEVELTDQLQEANAALREPQNVEKPAAKTRTDPLPADQAVADPAFVEWKAANPWLDTDTVRLATAEAIGRQITAEGAGLRGKAFFSEVDKRLAKIYGAPKGRSTSKVEGSGGGAGEGGGGDGSTKVYSDLPKEAKDQCAKDAVRLVGEKKAFKKLEDWQRYYAEQYFATE